MIRQYLNADVEVLITRLEEDTGQVTFISMPGKGTVGESCFKTIPFASKRLKLVYKDHPRDQQTMVLLHRCFFLYISSTTWKLYSWRPVKCGLYGQVVFIYRWSLKQV